jgi:hypothetical protein
MTKGSAMSFENTYDENDIRPLSLNELDHVSGGEEAGCVELKDGSGSVCTVVGKPPRY